MARGKKPYSVKVKRVDTGEWGKPLPFAESWDAKRFAVSAVKTGNVVRAVVLYQPESTSKPRVLAAYYPNNGVVWFHKAGLQDGPVADEKDSPPGGFFLND